MAAKAIKLEGAVLWITSLLLLFLTVWVIAYAWNLGQKDGLMDIFKRRKMAGDEEGADAVGDLAAAEEAAETPVG